MRRATTGWAMAALLALASPSVRAQGSSKLAATRAPEEVPLRLSFGGGLAARWGGVGRRDAAVPIEVTLTRWHLVSLSTGSVFSGDGVEYAYGELGFWAGVSIGAGAGYGAYQSPSGRKGGGTAHFFLGVPIPVTGTDAVVDQKPWLPYLLPYYRPSWGPWPGAAHEVGLMFKVSYGLIKGTWNNLRI
jgi:hypothetical protein